MAVVRLGALCELKSETSSQVNFRVSEYAVLDDGSEIVLHSDRGYTVSVHGGEHADIWKGMTTPAIEREVLTVVSRTMRNRLATTTRGTGSFIFSPA